MILIRLQLPEKGNLSFACPHKIQQTCYNYYIRYIYKEIQLNRLFSCDNIISERALIST